MRLVIFGPQGAGKGTQAARIAEKYVIPAIATGDIFRAAVKAGNELGDQVREVVKRGSLVPDELTIRVVAERLRRDDCRDGFLLDGFPRNLAQALALDEILGQRPLDAALVIEVPDDVAVRRITRRRVCSGCGRNYHVDAPPLNDWTCDVCGSRVEERNDDLDEGTIRHRLALYHEETEPLKAYYRDKSILRVVDGTATPDEVFAHITAVL